MCEIENKIEFCKGVRDTLKYNIKALDKIEHKIKLESSNQNMKNCAWDVTFTKKKTTEDILRESGFRQDFGDYIDE